MFAPRSGRGPMVGLIWGEGASRQARKERAAVVDARADRHRAKRPETVAGTEAGKSSVRRAGRLGDERPEVPGGEASRLDQVIERRFHSFVVPFLRPLPRRSFVCVLVRRG